MLRNIRLEPSKRPKRWATRSVYELTCDHCGLEFEKKYTSNKVLTSKHFCSRKCKHESQSCGLMRQITQNPFTRDDVKAKIRSTNLQRYGVERPSQLDEVKQKAAATWMSRYGVDAPMKSESIRKKSRETCMERYGVPNVSKNEEIKQKIANTNIERHGSACAFVFSAEKIKETLTSRYGVENPMHSIEIKAGMIERCRIKYGVDHPMQVKEIHEKAYKNARSNHETGHIDTPWGNFWFRSSWERMFLEWCIETNTVILDANVGIPYVHNDKNRVYYADFLIQRGEKKFLCEIKPAVIAALEVNLLKFEAARLWCSLNNVIFSHLDEIAMSDLNARFALVSPI